MAAFHQPANFSRVRASFGSKLAPKRWCFICHAFGSPTPPGRAALMLKYVNEADPKDTESFVKEAPPAVVAAMRQTILNLVGTLPAAYFDVRVSTAADSLAQLFFTIAMTGYLFRSAQQLCIRADYKWLRVGAGYILACRSFTSNAVANGVNSLAPPEAPSAARTLPPSSLVAPAGVAGDRAVGSIGPADPASSSGSFASPELFFADEEHYAPGVQKTRVEGEVLRWHHENGLERIDAATYMSQLEEQILQLKLKLAAMQQQQQAAVPPPARCSSGSHGTEAGGWQQSDGGSVADPRAAALSKLLPTVTAEGFASSGMAAAAAVAAAAGSRGELLDFLKDLSADSMVGLTADVSPDVLDAIDAFVARLMGTSDYETLRSMSSEFDSSELSKVLLWLLVVGYALRTAEMRLDDS